MSRDEAKERDREETTRDDERDERKRRAAPDRDGEEADAESPPGDPDGAGAGAEDSPDFRQPPYWDATTAPHVIPRRPAIR
jgi:hypothetical protein